MTRFDKQDLLQKVISSLQDTLDTTIQSAMEAKEFSTNEESKAENKYDTRGLEASYLASGQSQRAKKLEEQIYNLKKVLIKPFTSDDPINVGALVKVLKDPNIEKWFFILPAGAVEITVDNVKISTLTLESPLGRRFYQCHQDDEVDHNGQVYEILEVQ